MGSHECYEKARALADAAKAYHDYARAPGHIHPPDDEEIRLRNHAINVLGEFRSCIKYGNPPQSLREAADRLHDELHEKVVAGDLAGLFGKLVEPLENWIADGCRSCIDFGSKEKQTDDLIGFAKNMRNGPEKCDAVDKIVQISGWKLSFVCEKTGWSDRTYRNHRSSPKPPPE